MYDNAIGFGFRSVQIVEHATRSVGLSSADLIDEKDDVRADVDHITADRACTIAMHWRRVDSDQIDPFPQIDVAEPGLPVVHEGKVSALEHHKVVPVQVVAVVIPSPSSLLEEPSGFSCGLRVGLAAQFGQQLVLSIVYHDGPEVGVLMVYAGSDHPSLDANEDILWAVAASHHGYTCVRKDLCQRETVLRRRRRLLEVQVDVEKVDHR